ncbi:Phage regulatory protein [Bifidobacterium dentium]|nr:transcriptional regulator, AlpA family [Bifidobacterium dentium ATCC 27678]BAQ26580.1 hypothetical protein BBDE_0586 [Bifidobacterium dentium JCM 1195 = DSM 20436]SEB73121.1 Predicted DNA-binding transcriptional regulator AlpA [Bifidobacterium dentium JCM 1195 = DSM 20436]VEG23249.1 Phage regulatory protein [Bifidobacterium dentium]
MDTQVSQLWTVKDLAQYLGVSVSAINHKRCYAPDQVPPAIKIGSRVRWRPETVEAWLDAHTEVAA